MKTLIVGSGAVGGLTAAFTSKGGADVTLLCREEETARRIREEGLRITGKRGDITHKMNAVSELGDPAERFDHILLATKAQDAKEALRDTLPYLKQDGLVTGVQNGMALETVEKLAGEKRSAACTVGWSCTKTGDASLRFNGEGFFVIGRAGDKKDKRLRELQSILQYAAPVLVSEHIREDAFSKLILTSAVYGAGLLHGGSLGEFSGEKSVRRFFAEIVREDLEIAKAMRLRVPAYGGRLDYAVFARGDGFGDRLRRNALIRNLSGRYQGWVSTDYDGMKRGEGSEIPYIHGWLSETALKYRVLSPLNDGICKMAREMERGERKPSADNIRELLDTLA